MKNKEIYKRNLPHIQPAGQIFFVTWNLKDAIPKSRLLELRNQYIKETKGLTKREKLNIAAKLHFKNYDIELHNNSNRNHYLKDDRLAKIVADTIQYWDNRRIELYAYCIMSNHVHAVFHVFEKDENDKEQFLHNIMESIKKFSARECNIILNRTGKSFWQDESYDRVVRNRKDLFRIISYILDNPVKAGLCKERKGWKWSYTKESYNDFL